MGWAGKEQAREKCKLLFSGNLKGKEFGRRRSRWKVKIKTDFKEIGCENVYWIKLAKDNDQRLALGNTVINISIL
jgi:hypothetical protein